MHEVHPDRLWLGNAMDVREPRRLFDLGIAAVVDVAFEEAPASLPRQLVYCRFPLNDGGGNDPSLLRQTIQIVGCLLDAGTPTVIACSAGLSRSPTVAAFALARHLSQQPEEALKRIAQIKALDVKSTLWNDFARALARQSS